MNVRDHFPFYARSCTARGVWDSMYYSTDSIQCFSVQVLSTTCCSAHFRFLGLIIIFWMLQFRSMIDIFSSASAFICHQKFVTKSILECQTLEHSLYIPNMELCRAIVQPWLTSFLLALISSHFGFWERSNNLLMRFFPLLLLFFYTTAQVLVAITVNALAHNSFHIPSCPHYNLWYSIHTI